MKWIFLLVSTFAWGIAEIFYKKGNLEKEKYSHLKTTVFVGLLFFIYSLVITIIQTIYDVSFIKYIPINMIIYLPVALCYIVSMTCSYFGVRFIEESISDPIENAGAAAIVPILSAIFLHENPGLIGWIGIAIVVVGLFCVSFFDKEGKENRHLKFGKKMAIFAIAMPFCYALLDSLGTFLDLFYTEEAADSLLRGVTDANLEHMANCCYEFTFFIVAIGILIFLKVKKVNLFTSKRDYYLNDEKLALTFNDSDFIEQSSFKEKLYYNKDKLLSALFETIGQATYLFALTSGGPIACVILGAGTVIISLILSAIFLKERLTYLQYIFIGIVLAGIIVLSFID